MRASTFRFATNNKYRLSEKTLIIAIFNFEVF